MSDHDQRHQHRKEEHEHDRAEKKHHAQGHGESNPKPLVHPKWLFVIGVLLMLGVVLVWTMF